MNRRNFLQLAICGALYCVGIRPSPGLPPQRIATSQRMAMTGGIIKFITTNVPPGAGMVTDETPDTELKRVFSYHQTVQKLRYSFWRDAEKSYWHGKAS